MIAALLQLALFAAKSIIILAIILVVLLAFFILLVKSRQKQTGRLQIKNLNHKYAENNLLVMEHTLPKKEFKKYLKDQKAADKKREENYANIKNIYVLNFNGDIKASAVTALSEEITVVLNAVKPKDEVVVRLESPGGTVHGYGLGAAQLMRIRARNIPLTIAIDKVAASGGYMMACIANKILAAPFAIIGSIGVIIQFPNFNRVLKDKHIEFEMQTAGEYKRTVTMFGENTDAGREKLQEEIENIHMQFKDLIKEHRPQINLAEVATGEHWLAQQALSLQLVDEIKTSDEYLLSNSHSANIFEICFEEKKPLLARLTSSAKMLRDKFLQLGIG
jgi:serine protease SohB